ncbi:unnamed protein product [Linum trigynum]|uniref:Uncharacterized protein n=1 Tax=Linum trigynum TaxID=586398 RepID=A0AAV2DT25_9ROSI
MASMMLLVSLVLLVDTDARGKRRLQRGPTTVAARLRGGGEALHGDDEDRESILSPLGFFQQALFNLPSLV